MPRNTHCLQRPAAFLPVSGQMLLQDYCIGPVRVKVSGRVMVALGRAVYVRMIKAGLLGLLSVKS